MFQITYIFHSGFAIETDEAILIIDCWIDRAGVIPGLLAKDKPIYVLASHFHEDHFNPRILAWREQHQAITYILSKDILRHRRAEKTDADVWLAKGGEWSDDLIHVQATGSTDIGVSWIITIAGKTIFHAGDLNNWYARFLSDGQVPELIHSDEMDEDIDPIGHEKQFLGELKDILKITDTFDVVMFPIDGRIGNGYTRGGRQFIERFSVGLFVPMHFVASGFASSWRFREFTAQKNIPFWEIHQEGEVYELDNSFHIIS